MHAGGVLAPGYGVGQGTDAARAKVHSGKSVSDSSYTDIGYPSSSSVRHSFQYCDGIWGHRCKLRIKCQRWPKLL